MPNLTELASWADIVAVIVAVIAIGVSIWLYFRGRERRGLACEFDPVVSPVEIKAGEALGGDIEIRYKGEPVENLFTVRATITNIGNVPVRKSEVVEPFVFDFGDGAELVRRPEIIGTYPENLKVFWRFPNERTAEVGSHSLSTTSKYEHQAILGFELLNPGEGLTTEFLCTGEARTPEPSARIEGITRIQVRDNRDRAESLLRRIQWIGAIVSIVGIGGPMLIEGYSARTIALVVSLYVTMTLVAIQALLRPEILERLPQLLSLLKWRQE
jgi:hypothetical protein